ncbi:MAG: alpha/beta hydrolase [Anaerolineae bacterium]|nr:alpha/beta hydrolase [Anaerolineae bacterium]
MNIRTMLIICAFTLLLAACGQEEVTPTATTAPTLAETATESPPTVEPTATQPQPTATPTEIPVTFEPSFTESACPFALPPDEVEGETIICGYVTVPEDRANDDDATIRLAIAVFKATGANAQPDPVILLAGGPGEKTVANAQNVALILQSFRDERDLIIFDQRGVGLSEPALECPEFTDAILATTAELDTTAVARTIFDGTMMCRDRLVAEGHNLSAFNSAENAADVDAIRQALGYELLNLYGGSYGSVLAQTIMRDYPEGVRSVIIGAILPVEASFFVDVPTNIVNATLHLLDRCASDEACNAAYPDLEQTLYDTIEQLNTEPVPITITDPLTGDSYDTWLTGDAVFDNLVTFLYITDIIPVLPQAISDVANGDYELMTQLSSTKLALLDAISRGMLFSVFCAEDLIGVTPADYLETREQIPPQLAGNTDPEDFIEYDFFGICANWPADEADLSVKEPVVSDLPTLILQGEFDPVTPLIYAETVAEHLDNSYLYEFPTVGHNVLLANDCARQIADAFLDNPTSEPDTSCIARIPTLAFDLPQVDSAEIELEPVTDNASGLSSVGPVGWDRPVPGTFVRGENALDATALIIEKQNMSSADLVSLLQSRLNIEQALEPVGQRETDSFTWTLYAEEVQGIAVDFAVADIGEADVLLILLQGSPEERDILLEAVFYPAIDHLTQD